MNERLMTLDDLQRVADDIQIRFGCSTLVTITSNHLTRRRIIQMMRDGTPIYGNTPRLNAARGLPDNWLVFRYDHAEPNVFAVDMMRNSVDVLDVQLL